MTEQEKKYQQTMNAVPAVQRSSATAHAAANLGAVENAAKNAAYNDTADAILDRAINEVLSQRGYHYDTGSDAAYQDFARQYSQNALRGRELAHATADGLANGYGASYGDAVGSETSHDIVRNVSNYVPQFRASAQQEAAARNMQSNATAQLFADMANTEYGRGRDARGDVMNYINYLANRYQTERQADVQRGQFNNDAYKTRLAAETAAMNEARQQANNRYLYGTQSAESRAKLAADQNEFNRKLEYTQAKDAYDDRVAAEKAAAKAEAQQAKAEAKAAKQLEKDKTTFGRNAYIIDQYLNNGKELTGTQGYDLDYNKDGKVDKYDLDIAKRGSETGRVEMALMATPRTSTAISALSSTTKNWDDDQRKEFVKYYVERSKLNDQESAFVYNYFGLG